MLVTGRMGDGGTAHWTNHATPFIPIRRPCTTRTGTGMCLAMLSWHPARAASALNLANLMAFSWAAVTELHGATNDCYGSIMDWMMIVID